MMDLAIRDIRRDLGRFVLTAAGLGMLMSVVLAMTGIYNGMVVDAMIPNRCPVGNSNRSAGAAPRPTSGSGVPYRA